MVITLDTLSTELLLKIFIYLDIHDMCRLKQTCKRFNEIIDKWANHLNKNIKPLVTNQVHDIIIKRSNRLLSPFERLRICRNWTFGIYKEKALLYSKSKYIPWLQLDKDLLWISRGNCIRAYQRNGKGINTRKVVYEIKGNNRSEVCKFVKKNNVICSGQMNGSLWFWSIKNRSFLFELDHCHEADVNSVDTNDDIVASGSKDNFVKIWKRTDREVSLLEEINLQDRVWSVALSENKSHIAIGTAGISSLSTVKIFDLSNETFSSHLTPDMQGAGVLDIKWESPNSLWSCGYDSCVRRWDTRTGKCEQILLDPLGATIYCFEYDYYNTIISGTQSNGRVVLWDTRQNRYVQLYFMESCREKSSPIYSVSYDPEFLFALSDQYLNVLDFSVFKAVQKDYYSYLNVE